MIERTKRRLDATTPSTIMAMIAITAAIAISGLLVGLSALNTRVDQRGQQATRDAVCAILAGQIPRAGEPTPATDRGRFTAGRSLEQYRALGCTPTL